MPYDEKPFEAFAVGDRATYTKRITEADVQRFARLSGDRYPVHVDEEYAKTTRFGRRIAHGMLTASLISTANGLLLQRPGGISVSQTLHFRAAVYPGDTITAASEVIEVIPSQRRLRCRTTCTNQRGEVVIDGEAIEQKDAAPAAGVLPDRAPRAVTLYADGGARGNPGPAALGAVLEDAGGNVLREVGEYLGTATNNVAEWRALIAGLEAALAEGVRRLKVRLDSELVVRQLSGAYRVKHPLLVPLHDRARSLMRKFEDVEVEHVPRKRNAAADRVVNAILDERARMERLS